MQAGWTILAINLFSRPPSWRRFLRIPQIIIIVAFALLTWAALICVTQFAISVT